MARLPDQTDPGPASGWLAGTATDSAEALHHRPFPDGPSAQLWRLVPTRRAVVLGSRQSPDVVRADVRRAGRVEVATRRSGGGAVIVDPAATLWVDVFIPRDGPLWSEDLGHTFVAVGTLWHATLAALGLETEIWRSRPDPRTADLGARACFAGVGWGELLFRGRKVVGLSQRRTRWGARVQCLYDPRSQQEALLEALALSESAQAALAAAFRPTNFLPTYFLPTMSETPAIDAVWAALVDAFEATAR